MDGASNGIGCVGERPHKDVRAGKHFVDACLPKMHHDLIARLRRASFGSIFSGR